MSDTTNAGGRTLGGPVPALDPPPAADLRRRSSAGRVDGAGGGGGGAADGGERADTTTSDRATQLLLHATPRPGRAGSVALPSQREVSFLELLGRTGPLNTTSLAPPAASQLLLRRHSAHCGSTVAAASGTPGPPPPVPIRTKPGPPPPICQQLLTNRPSASMSMGPLPLMPPLLPPLLPPPPGRAQSALSALTEIRCQASSSKKPNTPVSPDAGPQWGQRRAPGGAASGAGSGGGGGAAAGGGAHDEEQIFTMPQSGDGEPSRRVQLRQDSSVSVSSDSYTSSPSYTSKSMETPLLPPHKATKPKSKSKSAASGCPSLTRSSGVAGSEDSCTDSAIGSAGDHSNGSLQATAGSSSSSGSGSSGSSGSASVITKSHSTPASLQAVVRLSACGSNISLHHKIIRDMRRPSSCRPKLKLHKFQVAQIILNLIALGAITFGLTAYFKANPAVKYINTEVANPLPGVCMPVIVSFCQKHRIPYNYTVVPSYAGHMSQQEAQQDILYYDTLVDVHCYELSPLFLCTVFAPKCGPKGRPVKPCRSLCIEMMRRCEFFLEVFGLLFDGLRCDKYPEYDKYAEHENCIGHHEYLEAKGRQDRDPSCPDGFLCDRRRCIPKDFLCDGHPDCLDMSDERNCSNCAEGTEHCGQNKCYSQKDVCNNKEDCPYAQDERNCLQLSDSMGDFGNGTVEVFHPQHKKYVPACVSNWDEKTSPTGICRLMGYKKAVWNRLSHSTGGSNWIKPSHLPAGTIPVHNYSDVYAQLRTCSPASSSVYLTCEDFDCGRRRLNPERRTTRIIGGSPSNIGDWPFLAALLGGPEKVFYCAGVLISDRWLLTAAHCVGNLTSSSYGGWNIQLGMTRRNSHSFFGQQMKVKKVVQHHDYNMAHENDVALFQLEEKVRFNDHLLPVCLPPANVKLEPGTKCTVIGWGKKHDIGSEYEMTINEAVVPILNQSQCNDWMSEQSLKVTDGMICAGYADGGIDACQGDSGGPLLCEDQKDRGRWMVYGIVSWGIRCAEPKLPGVYAYVPQYVDWIQGVLKEEAETDTGTIT